MKLKYGNKITTYKGQKYHSKLEAKMAEQLELRSHGKVGDPMRIVSWERQIRVPLVVSGLHICDYIVDFKYVTPEGEEIWCEVKGKMTDVARIKIKLFQALFPERRLKIVTKDDI